MKYLITLCLLTGCVQEQVVLPVQEPIQSEPETAIAIPVPDTKYKVGECYYLIDHENGKGDPRNILIVDSITQTHYIYRWWIYWTNSWAVDTSSGIGRFELFERMTRSCECPKQ